MFSCHIKEIWIEKLATKIIIFQESWKARLQVTEGHKYLKKANTKIKGGRLGGREREREDFTTRVTKKRQIF